MENIIYDGNQYIISDINLNLMFTNPRLYIEITYLKDYVNFCMLYLVYYTSCIHDRTFS